MLKKYLDMSDDILGIPGLEKEFAILDVSFPPKNLNLNNIYF